MGFDEAIKIRSNFMLVNLLEEIRKTEAKYEDERRES